MPGNCFIKFNTVDNKFVPGESMQTGHAAAAGWLEIGDWSWDIEADTNFTKGTGSAVGKATPGTMSFSHTYDKSSPVLMKMIVQGTHFKSIQIDMLKQTGKNTGEPELYFQLMAGAVFVTKVSSKGGEDGAVTQDIEVVFKEVAMGYKRQLNTGALEKTPKPFGWNISEMNFTTTKDVALTI